MKSKLQRGHNSSKQRLFCEALTCCSVSRKAHESTCGRGHGGEEAGGSSQSEASTRGGYLSRVRLGAFTAPLLPRSFLHRLNRLQNSRIQPPPAGAHRNPFGADSFPGFAEGGEKKKTTKKMRLIHNMTTIAECPAPGSSPLGRVIKMAVIGASGVGKTGTHGRAAAAESFPPSLPSCVNAGVFVLQRWW